MTLLERRETRLGRAALSHEKGSFHG